MAACEHTCLSPRLFPALNRNSASRRIAIDNVDEEQCEEVTYLGGKVRAVSTGQEDKRRSNLDRLARTANSGGRSESLERLLGHGGYDQGGPDGTGANNATLSVQLFLACCFTTSKPLVETRGS